MNGLINEVNDLIKKNATIDIRNNKQQTPLHLAALNGHIDVAQALIRAGASINATDKDDNTPLYNAANALMQLGRAEEASRQYQQALRSPDLALQGRAYYNRGNALYRVAEASAHSPAQALPQAAAK